MFKAKIVHRLFVAFLLYLLALLLPLSYLIQKDLRESLTETVISEGEERDAGLIRDGLVKEFYKDIAVTSVYAVTVAFLLSLLLHRRLLKPLKALQVGAEAVKKGELDTKIPVQSDDEIGEITRVFNEMLINSRVRAKELQRKELYVQMMSDALLVIGEDDIVVDINPAFTEMFGYNRNEVIGSSILSLFDGKDRVLVSRELDSEVLKEGCRRFRASVLSKEGQRIPVLMTFRPEMRDDSIVSKIGIIRDLRDEARLLDEVQESRKHAETIMNSIKDSILAIDSEFTIVRANTAALKKYGEDIVGRKCYETTHLYSEPCWKENLDCPVKEVFDSGGVCRTVHEHYDRTGKRFHEEIVASPVRNPEGEVTEVIELLRDVTERMRYMDELNRRNRELSLLNSIAYSINRSTTPEEMFSKVLDRLAEAFGMDGWGVMTLDEENQMLTCSYYRGIPEEFVRKVENIRLGDDIPGRVAITGDAVTTRDITTDERIAYSMLKDSGMKGYCCIPIKGKERVLGVYCLFRFKEHTFTRTEERILKSTGEMTGLALENIRLYEKMKEMFERQKSQRLQQQKDLLELTSRLVTAGDIKEVIRMTSLMVKDFLCSDAVLFWEQKGEETLVLGYHLGLRPKTRTISMDAACTETYAVRKAACTGVYDIRTDERFQVTEDLRPFRSVLSVPVMVQDRVLGVFTFATRVPRVYREDEIHFLRIVTSIFAVALERSQLYEKRINELALAETILNTISEGVCTVDTDGVITSANNSAERILGIPVTALIGTDYREIFDQPDGGGTSPVAKALAGEEGTAEYIFRRSNQETAILVNSLPLLDSFGRIYGAVQVFRDVTREKEIDKMKNDLIRSVSHEFRTPLSAIVGLTEMIIDDEVESDRAQRYLETIYKEGLRLTELVSDLLNISRIESGTETLKYSEIDFADLVESMKKIFEKAIKNKRIAFYTEIDPTITEFYGDRGKLSQLLANLIDNSIKYSDPGCRITLKVRRTGKYVIIEVADTGWGIPDVDLPRLSERFYRGRHGEKTKGTGLGLALCKEIVKAHDGNLEIESRLKEGTTVTVVLPIKRLEDVQSNNNR